MSDSVRPQRRKPTRLPRPWDSPGKNTGVGCHFLLQCMKGKSEREVTQSCLTLRDPMDYSLPGSSIHGIFQARVLEWGAIAFSGFILGGVHSVDLEKCIVTSLSILWHCLSLGLEWKLTWWTWVWVNSRSWWWTDREAWHAAIHGVANSQIWLSDWTELIYLE